MFLVIEEYDAEQSNVWVFSTRDLADKAVDKWVSDHSYTKVVRTADGAHMRDYDEYIRIEETEVDTPYIGDDLLAEDYEDET